MKAFLARLASILKQLWPWVRNGLAAFGVLCIGCIVYVNHQYALHHPNVYAATVPSGTVSPVAVKVAAELSPKLQALATEHKDEIIAAAGNSVQRFAAGKIFPFAVKAIPKGAEFGCDAALDYLDTLKASEVAGMLVDHASAKGRQADWTVRAAAGVGR